MKLDTDRVHLTEVEGQSVALDSHDSTYLTANPVGTTILGALRDGEATREEIVARVLAEFDVDEQVARRDCDAFVAQLSERGWLREGA